MYDVHIEVMRIIPGAKPPDLRMHVVSGNEAIFSYKSKRAMFDYFREMCIRDRPQGLQVKIVSMIIYLPIA